MQLKTSLSESQCAIPSAKELIIIRGHLSYYKKQYLDIIGNSDILPQVLQTNVFLMYL